MECHRCDPAKDAQKWSIMSGVKPGDGKPTTIKSAIKRNATCIQAENGAHLSCNFDGNTNGAHGGCKSKLMGPDGCKALPAPNGFNGSNACDYGASQRFARRSGVNLASHATDQMLPRVRADQAFVFNANGTVALWNMLSIHDNKMAFVHQCMQINAQDSSVVMASCNSPATAHPSGTKSTQTKPSQKWDVVTNADGTITIKQGGLCVDNNYNVDPTTAEVPELAHGGPWQPGA